MMTPLQNASRSPLATSCWASLEHRAQITTSAIVGVTLQHLRLGLPIPTHASSSRITPGLRPPRRLPFRGLPVWRWCLPQLLRTHPEPSQSEAARRRGLKASTRSLQWIGPTAAQGLALHRLQHELDVTDALPPASSRAQMFLLGRS